MTNVKKNDQARRKLLKAITGAGGAIAAGNMLPDKWARPMVDAALLPAHAQTSGCTEPCTLSLRLEWDTIIDLDLLLETPGGTMIDPKGTTQSQCLQHDVDGNGPPYLETISTIGTGVNPGTYRMYIRTPTPYNNAPYYGYTISGCGININVIDQDGGSLPEGVATLMETFTVPGS